MIQQGIARQRYLQLANCRPMKFLIESSDKSGKQMRNSKHSQVEEDRYFYNIMSPSNKIQCDQCKREISKATKLLTPQADYCPSCFANLQNYPKDYHVLNKLDFPLFDRDWTAEEELLLFEGLQKHGFGNWTDIADFIGTNKTREDVEEHYHNTYIANRDFMPTIPLLAKRDKQGRLQISNRDLPARRLINPLTRPAVTNTQCVSSSHADARQRGALTVHQTAKTGSPAEIIGYMPKRGDFQVQYDNDAELLLAQMEFNDEDTEEQRVMKFRLIDIYNQKLSERIRRKEFVISRGLLDLKEQIKLDRTRTKQQKEIYNMLKVFARFNHADQHEKLVQAVIKERQLRQRIQELKDFKRKGFKNLAEVQAELEGKRKKEDKSKRRESDFPTTDKSKTRRTRKEPANQNGESKIQLLSREDEVLCNKLSLNYTYYMLIKETIVRESALRGLLSKDHIYKMFKLDQGTIQPIVDLLVAEQKIIITDDAMAY